MAPQLGSAVAGPPFAVADRDGSGLAVAGPVDATTAPHLREAVLASSRGGTQPVSIDLTAVTLLGSAGVRVLHDLAGRASTQRVPLRLVAPTSSCWCSSPTCWGPPEMSHEMRKHD